MPTFAGIYYTISQPSEPATVPPLVLIHGAGGMALSWPPQIRRLSQMTVLAPDLPNHGKSAALVYQKLDEVAKALLSWLDALQIEEFNLCGHSMGGAICLLLALQAPQRVHKLILIGSAARFAVNPVLMELSAQPETLPRAVELLIKWSFGPRTPRRIKELTARRLLENHPHTLHQDLAACNEFNLSGELGYIQQPALILTGELDRMTPVADAQELANKLPNAQFEIISGSGHMVILEQPDRIAKRVWDFCR
ncbi:MAG: hydrolase, alpha/beta hydrolase fold family [Anaerolineae bacterium]|nr:MAG: hydrolase, alpha/beta hydrolase fold family [Anaerolineae bacterium]